MRFWASLLIAGVTVGCAGPRGAASQGSARIERLPAVEVVRLDRRPTTLPELTRDRPALVNLWATWCDACEREFDALNRLEARVGNDGLVIGVAVGEPYDHVLRFVTRRGLAYPQLVDEDFALSDALGSERVPTTLVVDRSGAIRYVGGELDEPALAAFEGALGR